MSQTPRTDAAIDDPRCLSCGDDPRDFVPADFARDLERENRELLEALKELRDHVKDDSPAMWERVDNAIAKAEGD